MERHLSEGTVLDASVLDGSTDPAKTRRRAPAALGVALLVAVIGLSACMPSGDGETAVEHARQQIGLPWVYGASSPSVGFDCSGLTSYAWRQAGVSSMPRSASAQYDWTYRISRDDLRAGDLVFYGYSGRVGHVGIYTGDGTIVHSPNSNRDVEEVSLDSYWTDHRIGYGRVPDYAMPG